MFDIIIPTANDCIELNKYSVLCEKYLIVLVRFTILNSLYKIDENAPFYTFLHWIVFLLWLNIISTFLINVTFIPVRFTLHSLKVHVSNIILKWYFRLESFACLCVLFFVDITDCSFFFTLHTFSVCVWNLKKL